MTGVSRWAVSVRIQFATSAIRARDERALVLAMSHHVRPQRRAKLRADSSRLENSHRAYLGTAGHTCGLTPRPGRVFAVMLIVMLVTDTLTLIERPAAMLDHSLTNQSQLTWSLLYCFQPTSVNTRGRVVSHYTLAEFNGLIAADQLKRSDAQISLSRFRALSNRHSFAYRRPRIRPVK